MHNKFVNVTKIFTFDSAHKLENYDGNCKYLHGHTYKLEITVRGKTDYRGMVIDFNELKKIVNEKIISKLDHKYLNDVFDFNTTCENMVVWIFNELNGVLNSKNYLLKKVRLWETPTSYAELEREDFYNEGQ
ncbi:6-pyruvoyltetrahydropterin/6-carboxytetrahydropterin synthase [Caminicella sporogenes DSM 14501]|uniref:6-carboxy-5,6,7,8-tetrahydropterin synthase n=1 Tax=Caminicella sporogenes DSM 14501 TaxID=1121266 RepID=A0A1M6R913_9FIRM|nr:6-carboxytetrahydropterin synthase QueD [Caminicella sporogenes]RKD27341.1 6-carboxytetrahydropterin synthase QueD [Caminicella sporogenes]SHK28787.1 6-pyruvoyltetrahydropterin/6-carboxytetrahydropterin synthase [Caminicella sporogenes DSM 14501]